MAAENYDFHKCFSSHCLSCWEASGLCFLEGVSLLVDRLGVHSLRLDFDPDPYKLLELYW